MKNKEEIKLIKDKIKKLIQIEKDLVEENYEQSLKYYRDIKNVVDTSFEEGKKEVAKEMKKNNEPIEK